MKVTHVAATVGAVGVFAFGAWLGCSSSSTTNPANPDGGTVADTGGGGDVVNPPPDSGGEVVSCTNYCTKVVANCTGANTQYADTTEFSPYATPMDQCMNICKDLPLGTFGETANSVGCRQYHAGNTPPTVHCPHAGPYGGALCGDRCDVFCGLATSLCTTANGNPQAWTDVAACKADCAKYPFDPDAGQFDPNDTLHLNCFEYHLREAYSVPDGSAGLTEAGTGTSAQEHCQDLVTGEAGTCTP